MNAILLYALIGLGTGTITGLLMFVLLRCRPIVGTIEINLDNPEKETIIMKFHDLDAVLSKKKVVFNVEVHKDAAKKQGL